MQRITIPMEPEMVAALDAFIAETAAASRSEAIRDLLRRGLGARGAAQPEARCFGVISCAIDQRTRDLARRVPQGRLDRHDQTVASMSVPVDHSTSIDVVVMRGHVAEVSDYADRLFLERGVLHGTLALVPVAEDGHAHAHGEAPAHVHLKVQETF